MQIQNEIDSIDNVPTKTALIDMFMEKEMKKDLINEVYKVYNDSRSILSILEEFKDHNV